MDAIVNLVQCIVCAIYRVLYSVLLRHHVTQTAPLRSVPLQPIIMSLPIDSETREELIQTAIQGPLPR